MSKRKKMIRKVRYSVLSYQQDLLDSGSPDPFGVIVEKSDGSGGEIFCMGERIKYEGDVSEIAKDFIDNIIDIVKSSVETALEETTPENDVLDILAASNWWNFSVTEPENYSREKAYLPTFLIALELFNQIVRGITEGIQEMLEYLLDKSKSSGEVDKYIWPSMWNIPAPGIGNQAAFAGA